MPLATSTVLFVLLIVILSALRTRLVFELSGASLLLFGSTRPGIILYSILVLPGTIIHELSHWLVAEILQVRTGEIVILPELAGHGQEERLGSVQTEKSDPFRGFLIGLAPFVTGLGILIVLGQLLTTGWIQSFVWWQLGLIIYGIMVVGNSMLISRSDRRTWPFILIFTCLVLAALSRSQISLSAAFMRSVSSALTSLDLVLGVTAAFNLVMIGGSYLVRRIVERLTKRRIMHKRKEYL